MSLTITSAIIIFYIHPNKGGLSSPEYDMIFIIFAKSTLLTNFYRET